MDMQTMMQTEIGKLYDMEQQLAQGLSFLASRATDDDLREALTDHREQTLEHARKLQECCTRTGWSMSGGQSMTTRAMIQETQETLGLMTPSALCDAFIIGAAQKAEHLEMAAYGTMATIAEQMNLDDAKDTFGEILDEEKVADKRLSKIAESGVNRDAVKQSGARLI